MRVPAGGSSHTIAFRSATCACRRTGAVQAPPWPRSWNLIAALPAVEIPSAASSRSRPPDSRWPPGLAVRRREPLLSWRRLVLHDFAEHLTAVRLRAPCAGIHPVVDENAGTVNAMT